jgi:hypothetical protein
MPRYQKAIVPTTRCLTSDASAGLAAHDFGKDLIDKAFHPQTGRLQPVSPVSAECSGLYHLLLGLFLFYRNPIAHREVPYDEHTAKPVLYLVNHALKLVKMAAESAFDLDDFVGIHEGQILRRRDFRLDIDNDGDLEIVILLELGRRSEGTDFQPHLLPVIVKKTDKGYRRIPAEGIFGASMYGAWKVEVRHVTNTDLPDIVVSWYWGESGIFTLILRKVDNVYVLARRDTTGLREPYNGPSERGFIVHDRQDLKFADVDGDGIAEMVQRLSFHPEETLEYGYSLENVEDIDKEGWRYVTRLLKWDAQSERIVKVDERFVLINSEVPEYYKTSLGE